jgi:hypothetical protein
MSEEAAYGRKASCAWRARRAWGRRGCRCRLSQCQPISSHSAATAQTPLQASCLLLRQFIRPNGSDIFIPWLPQKSSALTSSHAAGKAAGGHNRARCDGAPGDSGNSATGEHFSGLVKNGVRYMGECVFW